jgi:hypothetical protein
MPETAWETRQSSTFIFPFQPAKVRFWKTAIDGLFDAMLQSIVLREHHGNAKENIPTQQ